MSQSTECRDTRSVVHATKYSSCIPQTCYGLRNIGVDAVSHRPCEAILGVARVGTTHSIIQIKHSCMRGDVYIIASQNPKSTDWVSAALSQAACEEKIMSGSLHMKNSPVATGSTPARAPIVRCFRAGPAPRVGRR